MIEELRNLLEAIYRSSGWGRDVFEEQAEAVLSRYVIIVKPTAGTVTEEPFKDGGEGRRQMIGGSYWSSNRDVQFWRDTAKANQEDIERAKTKLAETLRVAVNDEAVLKYFEAKELAETQAHSERQKRRDALANELAPRMCGLGKNWYGNVSEGLQRAIDRIIEMEEAAK